MDESEKKVLRTNYVLLKDIVITPDLIGEFYSSGLLTEEMKDRLKDERDREKTNRFLDMLPQRGPKAFNRFISVIRRDYTWIAEKLEQDLGKMKDQKLGKETFQENESVTEDFEDDNQVALQLFAKRFLLKWRTDLIEHLKGHSNVIIDDKSINTIRLDDVGNLIEMTIQMCNKKRDIYKQKISKLTFEKEDMKSKVQELTEQKEEIQRKLSSALTDLGVSEFHLKQVKEQLNQSDKDIAKLKAAQSVPPNPESSVVGRNSRESTKLSFNPPHRGEAVLGNYKQPQITPSEEKFENYVENAKENSSPVASIRTFHEDIPHQGSLPEVIDKRNNTSLPANYKATEKNVMTKVSTVRETTSTRKVMSVSDKLAKPSVPSFQKSSGTSKYGRGSDLNDNIPKGGYQLRKGPQRQSMMKNQWHREYNQNSQRKQMLGFNSIPETKKYQHTRETIRSRFP